MKDTSQKDEKEEKKNFFFTEWSIINFYYSTNASNC